MFDSGPIRMHSLDPDGVILRISTFWAEQLGYTPGEMTGQSVLDFLAPESRAYAETTVFPQFLEKNVIQEIDYEFVHKDGSKIPVLVSAIALRDSEGQYLRSLAVVFDNSATKRAMALLSQKQRAETLGHLVGGVAHDFNNVLSIVLGNLEALLDEPDTDEFEAHVMEAIRATRRGASLTQQLLTFGRRATQRPRSVDLNTIIRDVEPMLRRLFADQVEFETVATAKLWPVRLDLHQLDTALLNLATNARDAMEDGGSFSIETANIRFEKDQIQVSDESFPPGRYVMLAVSDTGCGIPRDKVDRVVEPYFTTKPPNEGSGMGLAMVQGFISQSKGIMRIYSEPDFGTTVKMYFPALREGTPVASIEDGFSEQLDRNDRLSEILVVEDEADVRKIIVSQLRSAGYKVLDVSSADLAMSLLETGYRPKLLLSDLILSGRLQGPELAKRARAHVEGLKVVFLSGYVTEAQFHGGDLANDEVQLIKPVSRAKLARTVKRMLFES
ncbi:MAG: ATP-binding protein [Pseudomonadota bacterium]